MTKINSLYTFRSMTDTHYAIMKTLNTSFLNETMIEKDLWHDEIVCLTSSSFDNEEHVIFNEEYLHAIVCDSRIYNHNELREDLKTRGYTFISSSEGEVILYLFIEYGVKCLDRLQGMFAFVIYNQKEKILFAARDRIGEKQLYYTHINEGLVFGTEMTALLSHWVQTPEVNKKTIRDTLMYSYSQSRSDTWIDGIHKLEPGQYMEVSSDSVRLKRYWKKQYIPSLSMNADEAARKTLNLLDEAVFKCIPLKQPFAIPLSGGIDSSSIACLARRHKEEIHAISIGYKGQYACDERAMAKRLANEKGLIWHEVELSEDDYVSYFEEYLLALDEPICDRAAIGMWASYKKAKELGFPILLSGIGGDELFYGYPSHNNTVASLRIKQEFDVVRRHKKTFLMHVLRNYKQSIAHMKDTTDNPFMHFINDCSILSSAWNNDNDFHETEAFHLYYNDGESPEAKVYSYLYNVWLVNNCLHLGAQLTAQHGIELRSPYLDINLVDFVSNLPHHMVFSSDMTKMLLKNALDGIVPSYTLNAPKRGFEPASESIQKIIDHYTPKVFNCKLPSYNQVVMDAFLARFFSFSKENEAIFNSSC